MKPEHFDAVVVGSGFGGSVTAHRLAEAGRRVCVLERGKPYPPGSFARSPRQMARNFWNPRRGLQGLFEIWTFRGLEAVVASGLGGGSLIYANVLLRKDERWFVEDRPDGTSEPWPVSRQDLDPHYARVEEGIGVDSYPIGALPYATTPKTLAFQAAARRLGVDWQLPPLAVTFANGKNPPAPGEPIVDGHNLHGRPRTTCTLCGECDVGCNFGSKNTMDLTYLTRFADLGGEIRTRCEVRRFEPRPEGGFTIRFVRHRDEDEGRPVRRSRLPHETITADRLVLAAGTLGTNFLLLRNRSAFPGLSPRLGTGFCGNGDVLGFVLRPRAREDGKVVARPLDPDYGPVITSAMRVSDTLDGGRGRGFYLEDGGYAHFLSWMVEAFHVPGTARRALRFAARRIWNQLVAAPVSNLSGEVAALLGDASPSSGRLPMLGMGRDTPDGNLFLRGGYLESDWTIRTSREYFDRVRGLMAAVARSLGARFADNPLWYFKRVVTVHPVGGCPMSENRQRGVVDPYGQVFGYPGLSIADASVMPGPVGPNPSLTIAALADRFADWMIDHPKVGP
jgi:cholesterol oxidase